jgi:hypothetical protein
MKFPTYYGVQTGSGAHPTSCGYGGLFPPVKRPGRETIHLLLVPRSKKAWSSTSPHYVFMAWCLVKHRDNFTFLPCPFIMAVLWIYEGVSKSFRTGSLEREPANGTALCH